MTQLLKKYREPMVYIIVGLITTAINYIIHFTLRFADVNYYIALSVAWICAVLFSYMANRIFVFKSQVTGGQQTKEFTLFIGARLFSYGLEMLITFIFIDCAGADEIVWQPDFTEALIPIGEVFVKTGAQVLIVISNYIFSKMVIFRKK